jgi:hypothetical protein
MPGGIMTPLQRHLPPPATCDQPTRCLPVTPE